MADSFKTENQFEDANINKKFEGTHPTKCFPGNEDTTNRKYETGNTVWPGSIVLLKYLEKLAHCHLLDDDGSKIHNETQNINQSDSFIGKAVADLGSGTSITTLASALLGADLVVCTDGDDHVTINAKLKVSPIAVQCAYDKVDHARAIVRLFVWTTQSRSLLFFSFDSFYNVFGCLILIGHDIAHTEITEHHWRYFQYILICFCICKWRFVMLNRVFKLVLSEHDMTHVFSTPRVVIVSAKV